MPPFAILHFANMNSQKEEGDGQSPRVVSNQEIIIVVHYFNSKTFPVVDLQPCRVRIEGLCIEDLTRICADHLNISTPSYLFFGLCIIDSENEKYWLPPNDTLSFHQSLLQQGPLFFCLRFKPVRCKGDKHSDSLFGFNAWMEQEMILDLVNEESTKYNFWYQLLGQCEHELEKETIPNCAHYTSVNKYNDTKCSLWALLILSRSQTNRMRKKDEWTEKLVKESLPKTIIQNKHFVSAVKNSLKQTLSKHKDKYNDHFVVWKNILVEFLYGGPHRFIERYKAALEDASKKGIVFIDTQDCICYPSVKFETNQVTQKVCSLRDISSYHVTESTIELLLRANGRTISLIFEDSRKKLSFASELDAQYRVVIDWYANLCSDTNRAVYSPRIDLLKDAHVLPPSALRSDLPGVRFNDDLSSSIINTRPFVLQQSSKRVGCLNVVFSERVKTKCKITTRLRFFIDKDNHWTLSEQGSNNPGRFGSLKSANLNLACSKMMAALGIPPELNSFGVNSRVAMWLAYTGTLPQLHYIDPMLIEEMKSEGGFDGLPGWPLPSEVFEGELISNGNYSRLRFVTWMGTHFLRREFNYNSPGFLLPYFWQAAEYRWSHFGLASVVRQSPMRQYYLLDFAYSPLNSYFNFCGISIHLLHLFMAMKTICEALLYLSIRSIVHGDVNLANVVLVSHKVQPVEFGVKLLPPELDNAVFNDTAYEPRPSVFRPTNKVPVNDVYAFGVTMIQLLLLGREPSIEEVTAVLKNISPPGFPRWTETYDHPMARLFSVIQECLDFDSEFQTARNFFSECNAELEEIISAVKNLNPFYLNPDTVPEADRRLNRFDHISSLRFFQPEGGARPSFRGTFGEVHFRKWRRQDNNSEWVALKCVLLNEQGEDFQQNADKLAREYEMCAYLHTNQRTHANIIKVFGVTWFEGKYAIVMEYVENGLSLKKHSRIHSRSNSEIFFRDMLDILIKVVSGMIYLGNCRIAHNDLAARNVLISLAHVHPEPKIADFGLSCRIELGTDSSTLFEFPFAWAAPEIRIYNKCNLRSDVWSFGVLTWEVFCQKDPSQNQPLRQNYCRNFPNSLKPILENCWASEPNERLNFDDLYRQLQQCREQL